MDDVNDADLGIGEAARLVGLHPDTLRFYERKGVLPAPARDSRGRRRYSPDQVRALRRLVALKPTGMPLADIARFAELPESGPDVEQREALERRRAQLREDRRRIDASLAFLEHKLEAAGRAASGQIRYLGRPDAEIAYSVIGSGPWLFLVGAPAGRAAFAELADALSDRFTVVTHDPRGIGDTFSSSTRTPAPQVLAEDLAALVAAVAQGPVAMFGTSGGAVTVLMLLASAPHLVARALVHEPPLIRMLEDPELEHEAAAVFDLAVGDPQRAFERWLDLTGAGQATDRGEAPPPAGALPPLSPAELDKNRYFLGRMAGPTVFYEPDMEALAASAPVVCAGARSHGQLARRAAEALAARLGTPLQEAPGNHLAAAGQPVEVARYLRSVLLP